MSVWDWLVFLVGVGCGAAGVMVALYISFRGREPFNPANPGSVDDVAELPPLRPRELRAALLVGDDHPMWRAIMQSIDVLRDQADTEAVDLDNHARPPAAAYYAGAVAHLDQLAQFLKDQREKAKEMNDADE